MLRGMNYVGNYTMGRKGVGGICAKVTAWAYVYVHICFLCVFQQRYILTYILISNNPPAFCENKMILHQPIHEALLFAIPCLILVKQKGGNRNTVDTQQISNSRTWKPLAVVKHISGETNAMLGGKETIIQFRKLGHILVFVLGICLSLSVCSAKQ